MLRQICLFVFFLSLLLCTLSAEDGKGLIADFILGIKRCKCKCGVPNRDTRIIGGEHARPHEFPWLALIHIRDGYILNGALINDRYVMTAASKLLGLTPFDIKISLGLHDVCYPEVTSTNYSATDLILHPAFSVGTRANDIALLRLSQSVVPGLTISPVCLPAGRYLGQVSTIAGWSQISGPSGEFVPSCRPRKLGLPVLGFKECFGTAIYPEAVTPDKGCAGVIGVPSVVCEVDAGGLVMYRNYRGFYDIIGVLTDRNECDVRRATALYTNVHDHLDWIYRETEDACYCG